MTDENIKSENLCERTRRTSKSLMIWTFGWLISLAVVAFGPKFWWDFNTNITLIMTIVNIGFGAKMIIANKNHLQVMDELQRRIQLEAMALSLGVSMVFGAIYGLMDHIRLISSETEPSNLLFVMGISYGIGIALGHRRYM
ncbi:hypothetical protein [Aliiglaciecola sp. LCG003]|uniref:hypothetical protein n=1 Tax=Aliiglaciecola sp. LCG003 TaxID=3053655 RepID=UPI0025744CB9|nr:hypothetical protein [Aliiglaciecola sp. LCG003]WJG09063.1 hypothetical protein QR722_17305 [Aliiglaciecola sp. LCG003]